MVHIRPAVSGDASLLLALIRELAEFEHLAKEVVATEDDLRSTLFGPRPAAEALIAELDGAPVGYALFFHTYSSFLCKPGLYLEDLFVRPTVRSRGIGRALFAHLARLAVARGCSRFEWSVLDWNERARTFYQRLGAVPLSDWTMFRLTGEPLRALGA